MIPAPTSSATASTSPEPQRPTRRDVADHGQLDVAVLDLDAFDRALGGAHAAADLRRLERRARGRGGGERARRRAEHHLRVRADVDEEPDAPVEREAGREDAGDDVGADVRAERREHHCGRALVHGDAEVGARRLRQLLRAAIVNGAIESGSGSMPSAIWIIVAFPVTTTS